MEAPVITAEVEATTMLAAIGLTAADIPQPAIDLLIATRVIADSRHAVADIPLPLTVVSD